MRREKPATNQIYHVYNRGVEKRKTFLHDTDYLRFIHNLFEFNDENAVLNFKYYFNPSPSPIMEVGLPYMMPERKPRKLFVELMAFCLMPNHFHLMVRQKREGGLSEFMRKLGTGYTNYFNNKYQRVGPLFQGKYKLVIVKRDAHFLYLPYYIHGNPLDLKEPGWQEEGLKDPYHSFQFLETYRWSSFPDYIGKKNFPSVTHREFLSEILGRPEHHKKEMKHWVKRLNFTDLKEVTLEK